MKFIGTIEELRRKHGQGFSLLLTLKEPTTGENKTDREERIQALKNVTVGKFKKDSCELKEESQVCNKIFFWFSFDFYKTSHYVDFFISRVLYDIISSN